MLHSRQEYIVFFSSLVASGIFLGAYMYSGNATLPLSQIQSDSYTPLAVSLYEHATFTLSTTTPYVLEATHVPGYPLFLALTAAPFGSIVPALLIQMLLFAFSGILLFRLFEGIFSERVRFLASLLFVIEPYTAFTAAQPLTEALFLTLFISGLYVGRKAIEQSSQNLFFSSAILLGLSVLTRPIALYALPVILVCAIYLLHRRGVRRMFLFGVIGVLGFLCILGPWVYRNHIAFDVWALSTKGPYTVYFYDAALLVQYRDGLSATEANAKLFAAAQAAYPELQTTDDLRSPAYGDFMMKESLAIIQTAPLLFVKMYLMSLGTFFLSDGYRLLWYEYSQGAITLPNITKALTTGDFKLLSAYLQEQPVQISLLVLGVTFWATILMLAFIEVGLALLRRNKVSYAVLACTFLIVYFALLTGPVAQARYRIVVTPFLFMLAIAGAHSVLPVARQMKARLTVT